MSSLEIVAAPCRAKASSVSDLPAPMPPVMPTATGRWRPLLRLDGALGRTVAGLGHVHVGEAGGGEAEYGGEGRDASQGATRATRARMVSATKSSSCCSVPSLT